MADMVSGSVQRLRDREGQIGIGQSLLALTLANLQQTWTNPVASLKSLYSDFVVRELSPRYKNGEPLQLEAVEAPMPAVSATGVKRWREEEAVGSITVDAASALHDTARVKEALAPLIDEADLNTLLEGLSQDHRKIVLRSVTGKAERTQLHHAIKNCLSSTHVSTTEDGLVAVIRATAADRREEKRRSNPIKTRKFLHFTLYKENMDSNQAFRIMAKQLFMSTRQFQFSGTKDKRAVTLQRVAVRDMNPAKLLQINTQSSGYQGALRVCGFTEEDTGLQLGDACGNHFTIVLRLYPTSPLPLPEQLTLVEGALRDVGAINYFGPQRFGTTEVLTSDVGVQLLRGNYAEAVRLLFVSKACIVPDLKDVVRLIESGEGGAGSSDYEAALQRTPFYCFQERDVLRHLIQHPNDFLGCFQTLPRTLAMLYFHSVQSLLWNHMATRRLSSGTRLRAEPGDLVQETTYQQRLSESNGREVAEAGVPLKSDNDRGGPLPAVHRLTSDDPLDRFTLADVMLPIPGPDTDLQYPSSTGCSLADYKEAMASLGVVEGLLCTSVTATKLVNVFHYHGAYRPLCVRPRHVRLSQRTIASSKAPVLQPDLDALHSLPPTDIATAEEAPVDSPPTNVIVAEFSLPPGCYATSVLREFCVACGEDYHPAEEAEQEQEGEERGE